MKNQSAQSKTDTKINTEVSENNEIPKDFEIHIPDCDCYMGLTEDDLEYINSYNI
jgi:hypothetical protein